MRDIKFDAPVMLLFFNRPDVLAQLFEWVRTVKPKQLFLVQDGARAGNDADAEKIAQCRKIVENVDWECEVRRNYSEVNLTCDHREYTGIDWCFQFVDRLIILEDDCLPAVSFYEFCAELLEKYKDDQRIHIISGFNRCNIYQQTPYDYVFAKAGAGLGWATWKRVWDQVKKSEKPLFETEEELEYYNNRVAEISPKLLKNMMKKLVEAKKKDVAAQKIHSWEILVGTASMLNSSVTITPSKNLIKYNGITDDATHCLADELLMTSKARKMLTQCAYEVEFPLKHPPYVVRDQLFEKLDAATFKSRSRFLNRMELLYNVLKAKRFDLLINKAKKVFLRKK